MTMTKIQAGAVLYAKQFKKIAQFYERIADLQIQESDDSHVRLESGCFQLVVLQVPDRIAQTIDISNPPLPREGTPIKLVLFVASISDVRSMIAELGGSLNSVEKEWEFLGYTVCDGYDPEGNVFQLRALIDVDR